MHKMHEQNLICFMKHRTKLCKVEHTHTHTHKCYNQKQLCGFYRRLMQVKMSHYWHLNNSFYDMNVNAMVNL
jgi:hypothetical protein